MGLGSVDLHTHTSASDGSDSAAELLAAAAAAGVGVLAVTDHDTVEAVAEAKLAGAALGIEVLAGCEVTADVDGRIVHLLVYGEGLLGPGVQERVSAVRRLRAERNHRIGERLRALTGVGIEQAAAIAGGSALSRAHFARALIAQGVVGDVAEAFDRYLSSGRPAYVPAPALPVAEVVELAREVDALVVLAHPGRLAPGERERVMTAALDAGVDGLEVWHSQHDADTQRYWARTAGRLGLLATGGSDYHGRHKPAVRIGSGADGNVAVPVEAVTALRERLVRAW